MPTYAYQHKSKKIIWGLILTLPPSSTKHRLHLFFLHNGWSEATGSGQKNEERPYFLPDFIKFTEFRNNKCSFKTLNNHQLQRLISHKRSNEVKILPALLDLK